MTFFVVKAVEVLVTDLTTAWCPPAARRLVYGLLQRLTFVVRRTLSFKFVDAFC
jgi:hypothetical protein